MQVLIVNLLICLKNYTDTVSLPLDICYRCDALIVREINKIHDVVLPFKETSGIVDTIEYNANIIQENSAILCRFKAPLLKIFIDLLKANRSPSLKGSDLLGSLLKLLNKLKYKNKSISFIYESIHDEIQKLKNNTKSNYSAKIGYLKEQITLLEIMVQRFDCNVNSDFFKGQIRIMNNTEGNILLSTIHKSKGLEFPVVYIYAPEKDLSFLKLSKEEKLQEQNLKYVARSRAEEELYYVPEHESISKKKSKKEFSYQQ